MVSPVDEGRPEFLLGHRLAEREAGLVAGDVARLVPVDGRPLALGETAENISLLDIE